MRSNKPKFERHFEYRGTNYMPSRNDLQLNMHYVFSKYLSLRNSFKAVDVYIY